MFSRLVYVLSLSIIVSILLLMVSAFFINHWINKPLSLQDEMVIQIQPGDTLSELSQSFKAKGILSYPKLFVWYARYTERSQLEVGEYSIAVGTTPEQLLNELQSGRVISYSLTLVEGKTFNDFKSVLKKQTKITNTIADKTFDELKQLNNWNIDHPEGWFYPDTYQYVLGNSDIDILNRAYKKMQQVLTEEWEQRSADLPYKAPYEALIMASIVEKETGAAHERAEIAGVFVRRLKKGMRLQTDPTVIYGLGDRYKGNIRRKHLKEATPYNTYVIDGLPPTPIAMPGREAIRAALHPAEGKSLYFVAKGDGTHQFSNTLKEHNKAVQEFQIKKRVSNYRSSPEQ